MAASREFARGPGSAALPARRWLWNDFDRSSRGAGLQPQLSAAGNDALAGNFRLIYYDQRGRGKSSGEVAPDDVTIESEIEDLDRVRRHFGLDAVALLAHS